MQVVKADEQTARDFLALLLECASRADFRTCDMNSVLKGEQNKDNLKCNLRCNL